jgi:flagellar biosynthesis protein
LPQSRTPGRTPPTDAADDGKIAVALQYDPAAAATPRVVATGRGALAEQILSIAFAAGVRVREDADLAEILAKVDVDSEIPVEALAAVAEILAYVYRLNGAAAPPPPPRASGS